MPSNRSYQQSRPAPMPHSALSNRYAAPPATTSHEDERAGAVRRAVRLRTLAARNTRSGYEFLILPPSRRRSVRRRIASNRSNDRHRAAAATTAGPVPTANRAATGSTTGSATGHGAAAGESSGDPSATAGPDGSLERSDRTQTGHSSGRSEVDPNGFFPEDGGQQAGTAVVSDDLAEFFPEDASLARTTPAADKVKRSTASNRR